MKAKLKALTIFIAFSMLVMIPGCNKSDNAATTSLATTPNTLSDQNTSTTAESTTEEESTATNTEPLSSDDIKISMTWWGDTGRNEIYNAVIDLFEDKNPGVKVDRPFASWGEYFDRLSTQIAGGTAPDVIGMHQRYVSEYALRGAFADLQPFVDSGELDLTDFPESVIKAGYVSGTLYMVTQGVTGSGISYNSGVFDQLGVDYPDMDWTWDEYVSKLEELKRAIDASGADLWPSGDLSPDVYNFSYWVRAHGENLFTESGEIDSQKRQ